MPRVSSAPSRTKPSDPAPPVRSLRALAGLDRRSVYVTNAVKHVSWEPRGKRRIHKKPRVSEVKACDDRRAALDELVADLKRAAALTAKAR